MSRQSRGTLNARTARRLAVAWLRSNSVVDAAFEQRSAIGAPIEIVDLEGAPAGWFVPLTLEAKLLGFVQLDHEGNITRYATFQRRSASLDGCPETRSWLDPSRIKRVARRVAPHRARLGVPMLTYDRVPTRLVWAVNATSPGERRTIFVAGDFTYEAPRN